MSKTFLRSVAAMILLAGIVSPVNAFNSYGHMSVGYVAFQKLTPQTRSKVNALLAKNPDFPNWVAMISPGTSDSDTNQVLFMIATTWADRIKRAGGFHEDNTTDRNKCGPLSEQNIGFTDHLRHRCWHFIDVAFTQDNRTPLPSTPTPNAQERVEMFRPILGGTDEDLKAYDLSWILHLVGDLHQPLHCVARVDAGQTEGAGRDPARRCVEEPARSWGRFAWAKHRHSNDGDQDCQEAPGCRRNQGERSERGTLGRRRSPKRETHRGHLPCRTWGRAVWVDQEVSEGRETTGEKTGGTCG